MQISNSVLFTLLILALLLISWLLGYFAKHKLIPTRKFIPDPDYFIGLNYLLNDEPDDAIDVFINALEVNAKTLETHLALGTLLRRRGKVDQSIEYYEKMLRIGAFNARQQSDIRIHLVRSFIAAGLLDRAEALLKDLKQSQTSVKFEALKLAVTVYQMEKEWLLAIEAATELLKLSSANRKHDLCMQVSHFYCELAEIALAQQLYDQAREALKSAMKLFKGNIRVYLLSARIEFLTGNFQEAITYLQKALQIDSAFFSEIYAELEAYTQHEGMTEKFQAIMEMNQELFSDSDYLTSMALYRDKTEGAAVALKFMLDKLGQYPSLKLLQQTMQLSSKNSAMENAVLKAGAGVLSLHLSNSPNYRCENCGFELRNLHWACPGCNCWGAVVPIDNQISLAGDQVAEPI